MTTKSPPLTRERISLILDGGLGLITYPELEELCATKLAQLDTSESVERLTMLEDMRELERTMRNGANKAIVMATMLEWGNRDAITEAKLAEVRKAAADALVRIDEISAVARF